MSAPTTSEVLRCCFFGDGRGSRVELVARLGVWCLTLAILIFNALFRWLLPDGNLLIRGVATLLLAVPLLWLFGWGKRACKNSSR
ncbi:MAG: hypothetical protein M3020_22225 [Myxococcota bacterium]|nr:hypothetical protein [Myxococcota bacterium]